MTRRPTDPAISVDGWRLSTHGDALIAHPIVEIDLSNAERLGNCIVEATSPDCVGVVLDLTDVSFMDSFGIYVIIGLCKQLARRKQSLALVVPDDSPVLSTLRVSNVHSHLQILNGIDKALTTLTADCSRAA